MIGDSTCLITNVEVKSPGSVHNSRIFRESTLCHSFEQVCDVLSTPSIHQAFDQTDIRCLVLRGLPVIFGDDPSDFFKACFDVDDEDSYSHVPVGILCREQENVAQHLQSLHLNPSSVGIILEGKVVMDKLENLLQAMCLLFGLTYALHLNYPKCMKNTFNFIQQSVSKSELKPKIQS
ncbi:hypothetical protein AAFF_G00209930 [Aldrovandia affinis]|uniref:Uncharacterized protein n=1 Tax=Aldrovandia affinis TaxID=143900 RepID=A0AAD7SW87_9TELE|nr:hypothetical protein AAFF_G00209930 [Aldrovandia affinis]